jgi:hypothetical protein
VSPAGAASSLPVSTPLAPPPPKGRRSEGQQTRSVHCRRRLGRKQASLRDAFRRLDLALRRGGLLRRAVLSPTVDNPSTPFATFRGPPCQGDGSLPAAIPTVPTTDWLLALPEKMPRADFCSRLLLSRAPASLQLSSVRLAPQCPPRPASCHHRRLRASGDPRPSTTTPDSRCRHLRPRVTSQLTLRRPAAAAFTVPRGAPAAAGLGLRPRCRRSANPVRRLLTPPVAPAAPSGCPAGSSRARIRFAHAPSRARAPRIQGAFHRQVPPSPAPCLRTARGPSGRHRHPDLAAGMGLPTCVHAHSRALDPSTVPAIHRSAQATCRLPTSAVGRPTSTPTSCPNHLARMRWRTTARDVATALAGHR